MEPEFSDTVNTGSEEMITINQLAKMQIAILEKNIKIFIIMNS